MTLGSKTSAKAEIDVFHLWLFEDLMQNPPETLIPLKNQMFTFKNVEMTHFALRHNPDGALEEE